MTTRSITKRAASIAIPTALALALVSTLAAQQPEEKRYQIRTKVDALLAQHALAPDPKDDDLTKWRKARLNAALRELSGRIRDVLRESVPIEAVLDAGHRVLDAELDYYQDPKERVRVLTIHLDASKDFEEIVEQRASTELASPAQLEYAHFSRASIEIALLKARRDAGR